MPEDIQKVHLTVLLKFHFMFAFRFSVNELLKIKDELTKERDEKLSEITKVCIFLFCLDSDLLILVCLIHVHE